MKLRSRRLMRRRPVGALWIAAIAGRLYYLQVMRHEHYVAKAARQQQRVIKLDPPRGTIYDARGRELAVSVQVDSAWRCRPRSRDPAATARELAQACSGSTRRSSRRELARDREFIWVARKLDPPVAEAVRALEPAGHPLPARGQALLPDARAGGAGARLRGHGQQRPGRPRAAVRREGRGQARACARCCATRAAAWWWRRGCRSPRPSRAQDLHLTLDAAIQHIVERELQRAVEERGASGGMRGVPRSAARAPCWPWRPIRRSIRTSSAGIRRRAGATARSWTSYEPGSTFKMITARRRSRSGMVRARRRVRLRDGRHRALRQAHPRPQALRPPDVRPGAGEVEQRRGRSRPR